MRLKRKTDGEETEKWVKPNDIIMPQEGKRSTREEDGQYGQALRNMK